MVTETQPNDPWGVSKGHTVLRLTPVGNAVPDKDLAKLLRRVHEVVTILWDISLKFDHMLKANSPRGGRLQSYVPL